MAQFNILWKRFLREQSGQDLIEYTLLLAFVALAAAALFPGVAGSIEIIWSSISALLANAAATVP